MERPPLLLMSYHSKRRSSHWFACLAVVLLAATLLLRAQAPGAATGVTVVAKPATPTITLLSPSSGAVGATVTITGSGFNATQGTGTVTFNGVTATVTSWSPMSLTTTVPVGATTGNVVVQQNGLTSAGVAFTVSSGACNEFLNPGADIDARVSLVPLATPWEICLNSGAYGGRLTNANFNSSGTNRTAYITIRSTTPYGATIDDAFIYQIDYLKFVDLNLANFQLLNNSASECSTHIEFYSNHWVPQTGHFYLNYEAACTGVSDYALIIDGDTFVAGRQTGCEGRLCGRGVRGMIVRNSVFSGTPTTSPSDGFFFHTGSSNVVVGPGNEFYDIDLADCQSIHCDSLQTTGCIGCTIKQNYFHDVSIALMAPDPDPKTGLVFEDNVIDGRTPNDGQYRVQIGSCVDCIQRHNTFIGIVNAGLVSKPGEAASSGGLIENNLVLQTGSTSYGIVDISSGSGCTGCTVRYHLFAEAQDATASPGTNETVASPVWIGGTYPTIPSTWAGFQLAPGSPGENSGNDGQDLGSRYYGPN